ncbi:MAG: RagB/SusD family nutrient uptake outer membrane protein [Bacteroidaceae bacterium]|nr:RagB/SusD family nutrient uptake outer membrane protein [Bacteroidaceae bacterium]
MRHKYSIIHLGAVAAAAIMGLTACADFLEVKPRDQVTEDNFWNEKTDIDQMVAGVYLSMQSEGFINNCIVWGESRSDNIYPVDNLQSSEYNLYQIMRENLLPSNPYTKWINFYDVINRANTIIAMAPIVSQRDPAFRESDVKAIIAEMTALRSLCYFYLIRTFDEVPFYRDAIQEEEDVQYLPASSFDYVLQNLIADLEAVRGDAIVHYAAYNSNDQIGGLYYTTANRATRTLIDALLAEMYLWQGNYAMSVQAADRVIAQKRADYEEEYSQSTSMTTSVPQLMTAPNGTQIELYQVTTANPAIVHNAIFGGSGNSFESIFELAYTYQGSGSYLENTAFGRLFGENKAKDSNRGAGFFTPRSEIISEMSAKSFNFWENQYDARFYCNIETDSKYAEGKIRKGVASSFYIDQLPGSGLPFDNTKGSAYTISSFQNRNMIFYRLTDIMLIKAEALIMQVTDETTDENTELMRQAFDLVYLVNARSCTNRTSYLNSGRPYARQRLLLRELIRKERNRELMYEGKRWFDLLRYAKQEGSVEIVRSTVSSKVSSGAGGGTFPSMDALFWPYNKDEVRVNPNLHQKSIYAKDDEESYSSGNE